MKKNLFFAALALVALASCSDEQFVGENNNSPNPAFETAEKAIVFNSGTNAITRAAKTGKEAADSLNGVFVFAGVKGNGSGYTNQTPYVFDQYYAHWNQNTANTTESNSNDWEYVGYTPATTTSLPSGATQTIKFWDYGTSQYDFAAYSLGHGVGTTPTYATASKIDFAKLDNDAGDPVYTLTGTVKQLKACYISDLVTAYNKSDGNNQANTYGQVVTFSFRSLASKIRLAFYETVPGYSVKDLKFYDKVDVSDLSKGLFGTAATPSTTPQLLTANDNSTLPTQDLSGNTGDQTMKVYFPTVGWANAPENGANANNPKTDYNKAHVVFAGGATSSSLSFGVLKDFTGSEKMEAAADYIGRASNAATYAGGLEDGSGKYYTILPNETGVDLMIRVKYTLVSTDGSNEVINVDNATAVIPKELASWKPNYAYTYIFKLSEMTNGATGTDPDGNPVMGLTPITLNAVVVDSEDGVQETITTVSNPSITTYMAGEVVTDKDEYKVYGTPTHPIYIVVNNGSDNVALTAGTNAKLYTAVLNGASATNGTSAINPISEEAVDNALRYGVVSGSTYTVTDANGWNLVVTDLGTYSDNNTAGLTGSVSTIPASESPTGDAVNVTCASFVPTAPSSGTKYYVFQYKGNTSGVYGSYTAVAPAELAASGTTYYTKSGSTYSEVTTSTSGIKVVFGGTVYYTKGEDIYEPVTGALTAGTYYYYEPTNGSANNDGYVSYTYSSGDAPAHPGGYYTKKDNYIQVPYATLTAGNTYFTSSRGAGKFVAKGSEVVDAENKYYTETTAEVDAKYMYKIIKVVP